ncbi:MAG: FkbM family methyltransferase [Candidatus Firestonebacteria bacterium]|nr:FkbM family methyltransferase [Candidatus Firestonebacteria bacterium]
MKSGVKVWIRIIDRFITKIQRYGTAGERLGEFLAGIFLKKVSVDLNCGITIFADLRERNWKKMSLNGTHEIEVEQFLKEYLKDGDVVADVGAQVGMVTVVSAKLVGEKGKVHSFEPDIYNFYNLKEAKEKNNLTNTILNNCAVGEKKSTLQFRRPSSGPMAYGAFEITKKQKKDDSLISEDKIINVSMITLDEYSKENNLIFNLIKIDVDGPEFNVLKGSKNILSGANPPVLIVEVSQLYQDYEINYSDMHLFLSNLGYVIFVAPRMSLNVMKLERISDLPKESSDLFCFNPKFHNDRMKNVWFMK